MIQLAIAWCGPNRGLPGIVAYKAQTNKNNIDNIIVSSDVYGPDRVNALFRNDPMVSHPQQPEHGQLRRLRVACHGAASPLDDLTRPILGLGRNLLENRATPFAEGRPLCQWRAWRCHCALYHHLHRDATLSRTSIDQSLAILNFLCFHRSSKCTLQST